MASATVEQILQQVKTLPPEDRQQLREMIDALPAESPEAELSRKLIESGVARPRTPGPRRPNPVPVRVTGKPLSETIIEERR
jgi:hypothetical protein